MKKERKKRSIVWIGASDEEFRKIVLRSETYAEILKYFGLSHKGGNGKTVKARIKKLGIDDKHIAKGVGSNLGRKFFREKIPMKDILVKYSTYNRSNLKKRLISEGLLEYKCQKCNLKDQWNGKPINLVIDHINGVPDDNRLHNLRFLCPNCNSQTKTFAGRNLPERKELSSE